MKLIDPNQELRREAFSIDEASATTGIGRTKLYEAILSGRLKARKYGKRTLILKDDLRQFLESLPLLILLIVLIIADAGSLIGAQPGFEIPPFVVAAAAPLCGGGAGMTLRTTACPAQASVQSSDSSLGAATDSPAAEMRPLDAAEAVNRNESSDNYGDVVAVLNMPPFASPESNQSSDSSLGAATDNPAAEMRPLDAPKRVKRNESSDSYGDVVAVLIHKWRVIRCRDGIQWILQSRDSGTAAKGIWRGHSYCRTKEALLRVCTAHAGELDPTAVGLLVELPDWTEAPGMSDRMNDAASSASGEASMSLRPAVRDSGVMASGSGVSFANTGPGKDPASDMVTASAADQSRYGGDSSWR
jgi:excisionase family DNA binding protein